MRTHEEIENELDELFNGERGYWAEHDRFPVSDWQYEVANNDTRQGYREWLYNNLTHEGDQDGFFFCPACHNEWESAKSEDNCPKCGQYVQEDWDV